MPPGLLRSSNATSSGDVIIHIPHAWIVPLCAGGGVLLLLIIAAVWCCCCRAHINRRTAAERESELAQSLLHGAISPVAQGWLHKNRPAQGLRRESWKRRYCLLFGQSTMAYLKHTIYYFADEEEARLFYEPGKHRRPTPKGSVDLSNVRMMRRSGRTDLPANGLGIELHTQSRVWLLATPDDEEFDTWVGAIASASGKTLREPPKSSKKNKSKRTKLNSVGRKRRHSRADSTDSDLDYSDSVEDRLSDGAAAANNSNALPQTSQSQKTTQGKKGHVRAHTVGTTVTEFFTGLKHKVSRRGSDFVHSTRDTKDVDDGSFDFFLTKGWVYKRGRTNTSWKKRWFEHQNGILQYFTKEGGKLKGEMVVKGCKIETVSTTEFRLVADNRVLNCRCDLEEEAANWIELLSNMA